jgi:hypothetical protein
VESPINPANNNTSYDPFIVRGKITLTSPNGNEVWNVTELRNITWDYVGPLEGTDVNITFSNDDGQYYNYTIKPRTNATNGTSGKGNYSWYINETETPLGDKKCRVNISYADLPFKPYLFDSSNNNFTVQGSIALFHPNEDNLTLRVGDSYDIIWKPQGEITKVNISFSNNSGSSNWTTIVNNVDSVNGVNNTYPWAVNDSIGNKTRVRVYDATNAGVNNTSGYDFTIGGNIAFNNISGGDIWRVGDAVYINWTPTGTIGNVYIKGSTDNFATDIWTINGSTSAGTNGTLRPYLYTNIGDNISDNVTIKVADVLLPNVTYNISPTIRIKGNITVTSPSGGIWNHTENNSIEWYANGTVGNVAIDLQVGNDWYNITPSTPTNTTGKGFGNFTWYVGGNGTDLAKNQTCYIYVRDASDPENVSGTSAGFAIRPRLVVSSPGLNETLAVTDSYPNKIKWNVYGNGTNKVNILYDTNDGNDGFNRTIATDVTASLGVAGVNWSPVNNTPSSTAKIMVVDKNSTYINATSAKFHIIGKILVTKPDVNTVWEILNSTDKVTWESWGLSSVNIYLSINNSANWVEKSTSIPAGNQNVTISLPANCTNDARVKVTDSASMYQNITYNISEPFKLVEKFDVKFPENGTILVANQSYNINWSRKSATALPTVKVYFYNGTGTNWIFIGNGSNSGSEGLYSDWQVPTDVMSTDCRIRVESPINPENNNTSYDPFIVRGKITVTSPNGNEAWNLSELRNITWDYVGPFAGQDVNITYSNDDGQYYNYTIKGRTPATNGTAGKGNYSWDVNNTTPLGNKKCRVNVSYADLPFKPYTFDSSDNNFTVQGSITLYHPYNESNLILKVGDQYNINWSVIGEMQNVSISYSNDSGNINWTPIVLTYPAAAGNYPWYVNDSIGNKTKVRVQDVDNSGVNNTTSNNFTITGKLQIKAPIEGDEWGVGTQQYINWTPTGTFYYVKIEGSRNGFNDELQTWVIASDRQAGANNSNMSFNYTDVGDNISDNVRIRVSDQDMPICNATSGKISIKGRLIMNTPSSNQTWTAGTNKTISWSKWGSIGLVNIKYYNGTNWNPANTTAVNADNVSYLWTISDAAVTPPGPLVGQLRIIDADDSSVNDTSDYYYAVKGTVSLGLIYQQGIEAETNTSINWTSAGRYPACEDTVTLEYDIFNNGTWQTLKNATNAESRNWPIDDGGFNWSVPPTLSSSAKMKITLDCDDSVASQQEFRTVGNITLTSPNVTSKWLVNTTSHDITWTKRGAIGNVTLWYRTQDSQEFQYIGTRQANQGTFPWNIPIVDPSTNVTVQARDENDSLTNSNSSKFSLLPRYNITAPLANDKLYANENYTVKWQRFGDTDGWVNISYSTDGIAWDRAKIRANNTGSYSWKVNDTLGENIQVRIFYSEDEAGSNNTSAEFRVVPRFTVIAPNASSRWPVGVTQQIIWNCSSANESFVNLTLYVGSWNQTINASVVNNATPAYDNHYYPWAPPDNISQFKIRVQSSTVTEREDIYNESSAGAKIIGFFNVTAPDNASIVLTVGDSYNITWVKNGTVPKVNIDLLKYNNTTDYMVIPVATYVDNFLSTNTHNWTQVNDTINTTLKVRVSDYNDSEAFNDSENYFKIRGKFNVSYPYDTARLEIGHDTNITWNTTGNITKVRIIAFSTEENDTLREQSRFNYTVDNPYNITPTWTSCVGNGQTNYTWNVTDAAHNKTRIRVIDYNDPTVWANSSGNFSMIGTFDIKSPNGNESWIVNDTHTINWTRTGSSIEKAKITYSATNGTPGSWVNITETFETLNDGIVNNNCTDCNVSWEVPDALSNQVLVKIEDPLDASVNDTSNHTFKIRGNFSISSPPSGARWITDSDHAISWNTTGSIGLVNITYSKDDFATSKVINSSYPNTAGPGSYPWTVIDPVTVFGTNATTELPLAVKIRVADANDSSINVTSSSFDLDYYTIIFKIRDWLSLLPVKSGLNVTENSSWSATNLSSPVTHKARYGHWGTYWTHPDYGDASVGYFADNDKNVTVDLQSKIVHIWESRTDFVYTPANNTTQDLIYFTSTLVRDGSMAGARDEFGVFHTIANFCQIEIYDPANPNTPLKVINTTSITPAGFFSLQWANTSLTTKSYTGITHIEIQGETEEEIGGIFRTPFLINIVPTISLNNMETRVRDYINVPLTVIQSNLISELTNQTELVVGNRTPAEVQAIRAGGGMVGMVESALVSFQNSTNAAIVRLEAGADETIAAGQNATLAAAELKATAMKYSWNAQVSPDPALTGDMVTLTCQGPEGLLPTLYIYSWDEKAIVKDMYLRDTVTPGVYVYEFKADTRFTPGKAYTYVISEQETTKGMVAGSGMVESMSITTIAGLASAAPAAERAAKKALDAIEAIEAVLISGDNINIALTLKNLKESVDALPEVLSKEGPSTVITKALNEIAERLNILGGEEGLDFSTLLEEALGESPTIKDIRSKTETIQSIIQLLQMLFEAKFGGMDTPVVSTSIHSGSVIFRITTLNPSKTKTQKVPVKIYLPVEVKPKDIMDLGGLDLEYDSEKAIYYVYKDNVELAPSEVRAFQVEVEDVWLVSDTTLGDLKKRTDNILTRLEKTDYYSKAKEIADSIYLRLGEIKKTQSDDSITQQQHIGVYRDNMNTIDKIKEDLAKLEKVLATAGGPLAPDILEKTRVKGESPTKTMTWIIIFIIIIFIGLLAGVLFFTWQRQARITKDALQAAKKNAFPEKSAQDKEPGGENRP